MQNTSVSNLVTQVDANVLSSQLRNASPDVDPSKYIKTDLCSMYMAINIKIEPATKVDETDGKRVFIRYDQGCTAFYKNKLFNGLKGCVCSEKFPFHIVDTHNYLKYCTKEYIAKNRVKSAPSKNRLTEKVIKIGYDQQLVFYERNYKKLMDNNPTPPH